MGNGGSCKKVSFATLWLYCDGGARKSGKKYEERNNKNRIVEIQGTTGGSRTKAQTKNLRCGWRMESEREKGNMKGI